jgi:PncC family amidohydrolase
MSSEQFGYEKQASKAAVRLVSELTERHYTLALAESCTAGLVSELIARVSGASRVLWGSFVCYSPEAKKCMLKIEGPFLEKHGLVSAETAGKMALNALDIADVDFGASVTGLAGPLGDGSETPVGTVFIAIARKLNGETTVKVKPFFFHGARAEIRIQAALAVLEQILEEIGTRD